jgi:hypothetical protein
MSPARKKTNQRRADAIPTNEWLSIASDDALPEYRLFARHRQAIEVEKMWKTPE